MRIDFILKSIASAIRKLHNSQAAIVFIEIVPKIISFFLFLPYNNFRKETAMKINYENGGGAR
jgi:hypothetical protein